MTSQTPRDEGTENPPTVGSGGSDRFSHQMLALCYAGFLAILTTVAAHYTGQVMGGDPSLHRSPGMLVFVFAGVPGLVVYPKSSGDQVFVFANLAIVAALVFAGWLLGLAVIETGVFGQLSAVPHAIVQHLFPIGVGLRADIVLLRVARRRGILSSPRGETR